MSNCRRRVTKVKQCPWGQPGVTLDVRRACLKKARHFFQVTYSHLYPHRQRETKMEDIFGFCDDCAPLMGRPKHYNGDEVSDVRGAVGRVEKMHCDAKAFKSDQQQTRLDVIKAGIVRQMSQKNVRDLTPDDWKGIFTSAVEEFIVAGVQDS